MKNHLRVDPLALDLGSLAYFAGLAAQEAVLQELARTHPSLRFAHGYVFQHLIVGPRDIGALATLLGVTSQAASKTVLELERHGYVTMTTSKEDARKTVVALTPKAQRAIDKARALRAKQDVTIARALGGKKRAEDTKRALALVLEAMRGGEAVRTRRVRAPR